MISGSTIIVLKQIALFDVSFHHVCCHNITMWWCYNITAQAVGSYNIKSTPIWFYQFNVSINI